jgi:hypothetical protein
MKELVCNYALVRFLPYRETGEFVNAGVVLYAPEISYFGFKLTEKRNHRVKAFFPELDPEVYRASVQSLHLELARHRAQFDAMAGLFSGDRAAAEWLTAFRSMLRRRESLLHFAEPGMKLGAPEETLVKLYADYVLRNFARTPAYQETVMRNRLSGWLRDWGLRGRYKTDQQVGDSMFRITLPFVHFDGGSATVAIKPIDLAWPDPTDVYDHGGLWVQRFRRLAERGHLPPRTVVPILLPTGPARVAADEVTRELKDIGVQSADFNDMARMRELAEVWPCQPTSNDIPFRQPSG